MFSCILKGSVQSWGQDWWLWWYMDSFHELLKENSLSHTVAHSNKKVMSNCEKKHIWVEFISCIFFFFFNYFPTVVRNHCKVTEVLGNHTIWRVSWPYHIPISDFLPRFSRNHITIFPNFTLVHYSYEK